MLSLDDLESITKYDKSGILEIIESFPEQCLEAAKIGLGTDIPRSYHIKYSNIVCTGLGGSAIGSDILRSYLLYEAKLPIFVNRDYLLPAFVGSRTLVIVSSYSGSTEETISAYGDAKKRSAKLIVATSGGRLLDTAQRDGVPVIKIPKGIPPRCATGYMFFPGLVLLSEMGIIKGRAGEIGRAIEGLRSLKITKIGSGVPEKKNIAKKAARALYNKYPIIYAGQDGNDCAVTRWRGELAENAKTLSSGNFFPEMSHNEIVGFENPRSVLKKIVVVILRDRNDHPRISKRIDITKALLKKEGFEVIEVSSSGDSRLARIFSLVYTGDFVSFYLAILNRTDPTPVERIDRLKKELTED